MSKEKNLIVEHDQNFADAVPPPGGINPALPLDKRFSKTAAFMAASGLMRDMQARHSHN